MRRPSRIERALLVATAVIHLPFFGAAAYATARLGAPSPRALAAALTVGAYLGFAARVWGGLEDRRRPAWRVWLLGVPYFIHWCACAFAAIPSLLFLVGRALYGAATGGPAVDTAGFAAAYVVGLAVCAYGVLVRRRVVEVHDVEIEVRGLAPEYDGYAIAHLSDLHIGSNTPEAWGMRWVERANRLRADAAVVTGDLVTSGTAFHEDIARVVGALEAPDGVYVSMGNHDYFGDGEPLISLLRERGVTVLRNEGITLSRGEAKLHLAGLDDTWTRRADLARALAGRPAGAASVLLAHDPAMFPKAAAGGADLVLSGHTHGGQIAMPFLARRFSLSSLAHAYTLGLYELDGARLYVHPGLGTTGPPIRLGAAPAVVRLTLRAQRRDEARPATP